MHLSERKMTFSSSFWLTDLFRFSEFVVMDLNTRKVRPSLSFGFDLLTWSRFLNTFLLSQQVKVTFVFTSESLWRFTPENIWRFTRMWNEQTNSSSLIINTLKILSAFCLFYEKHRDQTHATLQYTPVSLSCCLSLSITDEAITTHVSKTRIQ